MERQLDPRAALLLKRAIEAKNIECCSARHKKVLGEDRATALELSCGRVLPAISWSARCIRPNTQLAHDAGIAVNGGIMVDDGLTTSDPNILPLGNARNIADVSTALSNGK